MGGDEGEMEVAWRYFRPCIGGTRDKSFIQFKTKNLVIGIKTPPCDIGTAEQQPCGFGYCTSQVEKQMRLRINITSTMVKMPMPEFLFVVKSEWTIREETGK